MRVEYIDINYNKKASKCVIALGYFDGVHLGHQDLIKKAIKLSKKLKVKSAILTFDMPIKKLFKKDFYGEITPLEYKLKIFEKMGLDICYVLRFNKEIASIEPELFIKDYLGKLNIQEIVCGSDYHYGSKASGDTSLLKLKYKVNVVDFYLDNGEKISSSSIINLIKQGNIEYTNKLLGKEYFIEGKVVKGLGNGHKLGFPTANISYDGFVLPKSGVYKVDIKVSNRKYHGICNIGKHPTIDELEKESLEVNILDFDKDIYNKIVRVSFISFIRNEIKYKNTKDLIKQLKIDSKI